MSVTQGPFTRHCNHAPRCAPGVGFAAGAHLDGCALAIKFDLGVVIVCAVGAKSSVRIVAVGLLKWAPLAYRASFSGGASAHRAARLTLTDVSQAYSKLLATVWRVSYGGVADNGCLHTAYINAK